MQGWSRTVTRAASAAAALCLGIGIAVATAAAGTDESPVGTATDVTDKAITTVELEGQALVLVGGGLLIGLGFGIVVASGLTYWYKNKQIGGKLR
ncbi:hypothetical protein CHINAEXTREME_05890 [Halobiforma lacisalsi AJ5]|uniref:Uncharacterized protein n=2 Tax=Natronobacterium lacisalsi TaxID=229731 RepID=M0LJP4_NATLA|nr:hypothetical protein CHINAEXTREME_05890 [Halobiforma lacisalsi AJ5]EMA33847.1 hypothetical protein C445_09164 [Halobiforma lacisalsi AJ5]